MRTRVLQRVQPVLKFFRLANCKHNTLYLFGYFSQVRAVRIKSLESPLPQTSESLRQRLAVCTCRALLEQGKVEMKVNYALSASEVKQGYILTCQSHPTTNSVKVNYDKGL